MLTSINHPKKALLTFTVFVSALFAALIVSADSDAEREALAQLIHELDLLTPVIDRAEREADPDSRVQFQYSWLRQDLNRVRSGIEDHIRGTRFEPRKFHPIRGEYSQ